MTKIIVLSDGETFDLLENATIVELPSSVDASSTESIEEYLRSIK